MSGDTVHLGTPITTGQATLAVLRCLRTPIIGDISLDPSPGYTIQRIRKDNAIYANLSKGEQRLVDIAYAIWRSNDTDGANIGAIGGIDHTNRRKVIAILAYLYLGQAVRLEVDEDEFAAMFGGAK